MTLDYTTKIEVKIHMQKYVKNMIDEFSVNIEKYQAVTILETEKLFRVDGIKPLNNNKAELFHTKVVLEACYYEKEQDWTFSPILRFYALE